MGNRVDEVRQVVIADLREGFGIDDIVVRRSIARPVIVGLIAYWRDIGTLHGLLGVSRPLNRMALRFMGVIR